MGSYRSNLAADGITTKIHALVDKQGRPIRLLLGAGQESDIARAMPQAARGMAIIWTAKATDITAYADVAG